MAYSWWHYWRNKGHITKKRVSTFLSIDSAVLYDNRDYPLEEGENNSLHGFLIKTYSNCIWLSLPDDRRVEYRIPVVTTRCHYGGRKHWFLCPHPSCQRRSKKLYLYGKKVFLYRKCLNFAYYSQTHNKLNRIIDKKWKLIGNLGADTDCISNSQKPKGMHWKTFERIRNEIDSLDHQATMGIALLTDSSI